MHSQPARQLQSLLRQYGPGLMADPQRTEALLSDLCGEYQAEIFVLVHTQRSGILADLSRMAGQRAESALRRRLAQRLQARYAFSATASAWAVDAWADALNIRALPLYQSGLIALWHFLRSRVRAHLRPAQTVRPPAFRASSVRRDATRSFFGRIGVQWKTLSVRSVLLLLLAFVLTGIGGVAWQNGWLETVDSQVFGQGTETPELGLPTPSLANAATALAVHYPPPLEARIEADLLNVRASPNLDAAILGKVGPLGANVTVDGFNEDGSWSHIAAPVAGWVSNEYVTVRGLYLRPALGQVMQDGTALRSEPRTDAPAATALVAGQLLVFVTLSTDGRWRQVVDPSPGWVENRSIELMER